jgi:hypothetical protein
MSRPTAYNENLALAICSRLAKGETLERICQDDDMPLKRLVCAWLLDTDRADFAASYRKAREIQAGIMAEELVAIADETTQQNHYAQKIRVDTRKWLIALYTRQEAEMPKPATATWNMNALNQEEAAHLLALIEKAGHEKYKT